MVTENGNPKEMSDRELSEGLRYTCERPTEMAEDVRLLVLEAAERLLVHPGVSVAAVEALARAERWIDAWLRLGAKTDPFTLAARELRSVIDGYHWKICDECGDRFASTSPVDHGWCPECSRIDRETAE